MEGEAFDFLFLAFSAAAAAAHTQHTQGFSQCAINIKYTNIFKHTQGCDSG